MSIWISRALLLLLLAGGCVPAGGAFSTPRTTPVLGGAVQIGLPRGYCIDRQAGREADDTAIVVMGRCRQDVEAAPAVLTTAIGPARSGGVLAGGGQALADYFTSEAGRTALSRTGEARAVTILQAKMVGEAFILHIRDRNAGDSWRGVESIAGRLVTITVNLPAGSDGDAEALLADALRLTLAANRDPA
jgi:hypothetical protein